MLQTIINKIRTSTENSSYALSERIADFRDKLDNCNEQLAELETFDPKGHMLAGGDIKELHRIRQASLILNEDAAIFADVINTLSQEKAQLSAPIQASIKRIMILYSSVIQGRQSILESMTRGEITHPSESNTYRANLNALKQVITESGVNFEGDDELLYEQIDNIQLPEKLSEVA